MSAARTPLQEDVPAVYGCDPGGMLNSVEDVATRPGAAAGIGFVRIRSEIRPAEFRQEQRPAILFAQRQIVFRLIVPVITPGVESDNKRDRGIRLRTVEERRLKRAVERGFDLDRIRFSPRDECAG